MIDRVAGMALATVIGVLLLASPLIGVSRPENGRLQATVSKDTHAVEEENEDSSRIVGGWAQISAGPSGHFVTEVTINYTDVTALIDTGATMVAMSWEDAESIGLDPDGLDYVLPVNTANGVVRVARITLKHVAVGGVMVENVPAIVMPRGAMRGTLIGMSFLSRLSGYRVENGTLLLEQ